MTLRANMRPRSACSSAMMSAEHAYGREGDLCGR